MGDNEYQSKAGQGDFDDAVEASEEAAREAAAELDIENRTLKPSRGRQRRRCRMKLTS